MPATGRTTAPNPTVDSLRERRGTRRSQASQPSSSPAVQYPSSPTTPTPGATRNRRTGLPRANMPGLSPENLSHIFWDNVGPTPTSAAMRTPNNEGSNDAGQTGDYDEDFERALVEQKNLSVRSGKQPNLVLSQNNANLAKKRSYLSGPRHTVEERIRARNKRSRASLPSEKDLYPLANGLEENPWALSSDEEGEDGRMSVDLRDPIATSTPVLRPVSCASLQNVPADDEFFLDRVDVSGHPPTPHRMHDSSFLERLRRSAEEGPSRNRAGGRVNANLPPPPSENGTSIPPFGSSPLPPSSPIYSDSPTPTSKVISEEDVQDLFTRNRMRLSSLLSDPEGPGDSHAPQNSTQSNLRTGRTTGQLPKSSHGHGPSSTRTVCETAIRGRDTGRGTGSTRPGRELSWEDRLRAPSPGENSTFLPLPNTRAAAHLQAQIAARAEELARARGATRGRTAGVVDGMDLRARARPTTPGAESRAPSDMDVVPDTPRSSAPGCDESTANAPDPWGTPLAEYVWNGTRSPASPRDRDMDRSPSPGAGTTADTTAPLTIPTILTAAAPEIDRPTHADYRVTHRVHRDDPEALIRGVTRRWAEAIWSDPPHTSVLLEVFNFAFTDSIQANRIMVETLRQAAYVIAGATDVSIVPPDADVAMSRRSRDAPRVWVIRGLSPAQEAALLAGFPWSFRAISFFTYKRAVSPDSWVLALDGFFDEDVQAITSAIRDVLEEPEQWNKLIALTRDHPDLKHLPGDARASKILDSIVVKTWRLSNRNVVTNVYIKPPTRDIPKWREWAAGLRARTYGNFTNGTGIVRRISNCLGCNSVDHPAHLCPFPELQGWQGPRAGTNTYSTLPPPPPPPGAAAEQRGLQATRGRTDGRRGQAPRGNAPRTPARWRARQSQSQSYRN